MRTIVILSDRSAPPMCYAVDHYTRILRENGTDFEETFPTPPRARRWREEFQMDFGRFDYVVRDGKYLLLDVNETVASAVLPNQLQDLRAKTVDLRGPEPLDQGELLQGLGS